MAETAPGEKLFIGRRPVRKWTQPQSINDTGGNAVRYKACFVQKNTFVLSSNQQKLLPPKLHFLTPIYTKSFVGWGFAPDPTRGAYSDPQTSSI